MIRTAIIGISGYGRVHLRLMRWGEQSGHIKPVAAVVINPSSEEENIKSLQASGCQIFDSTEAMWKELRGQIDLCLIPTPIQTHYRFTKEAIENGSDVFVEKPLTGSLAEAKAIAELARQHQRKVCVGFQDLYYPLNHRIKNLILEGCLGEIKSVKGIGSWPRMHSYFERSDWAGRRILNGSNVNDSPISNAMAHFLMLMLFWSGKDFYSVAHCENLEAELYRFQNIENFDTASIKARTSSGIDLFYTITHSAKEMLQPRILICGSKGEIEWNHGGKIHIRTENQTETFRQEELEVIRLHMFKEVLLHLQEGKAIVATIDNSIKHTEIIQKLADDYKILEVERSKLKETDGDNNRKQTYLPGLLKTLQASFKNECMLSEQWRSPQKNTKVSRQKKLGSLIS